MRFIIILSFFVQVAFAQNNYIICKDQKSIHNFGKEGSEIISGTPIITLLIYENKEWILFTPSGDFEGTEFALSKASNSEGNACSAHSKNFKKGLAARTLPKEAYDKFITRITNLLGEEIARQILKIPIVVVDPQAHLDEIMDLAVTKDNKTLISVSKDKTIRLWDIETGENTRTFRGQIGPGNEGENYRLCISPDQSKIVVGGFFDQPGGKRVGDIRFFDYNSGKIAGTLSRPNNSTTSMAFSKSGYLFAVGNNDKRLYIWSKNDLEKEFNALSSNWPIIPIMQYEEGIASLAFSQDEKKLLVSRYNSTNPALLDISVLTSAAIAGSNKYLEKHKNPIVDAAFSPNGQFLLTTDNREAHLWSADGTYKNLFSEVYLAADGKITFSPDGSKVLMGNSVYDFVSSKKLSQNTNAGKRVGVFISNNLAANAQKNEIQIWNTSNGDSVKTLKPNTHNFHGIVFMYDNFTIGLSTNDPKDKLGKSTSYENESISTIFDFKTLKFRIGSNTGTFSNNLNFNFEGIKLCRPENAGTINLSQLKIGEKTFEENEVMGQFNAFTFTKYGNILVATTFVLCLMNKDGLEIKRFEGFTGTIEALALSPDGRYFLSLGSDKTIRLWDMENPGKLVKQRKVIYPIASLYLHGNNEWICYTKDQYYSSSKKGGKYIGFHFNNGRDHEANFYTFEQMDLTYNRPDKVIATLGNKDSLLQKAYYYAYLKRLKKYGILESDLSQSFNVPEVEILTKSAVSNTQKTNIQFKIHSDYYPLKQAEVYINDVKVKTIKLEETSSVYEGNLALELTSGTNKIQIVAIDNAGQKSAIETIRMFYKSSVPVKPNLYIVTFGVSDYKDNEMSLKYAAKDANNIVSAYSLNKSGFNSIKTLELNNTLAVKENVSKAHEFFMNSKTDDMVILFVAGHGLLNDQLEWYFATHDIDFYNPADRGISFEDMEGILNEIPARKKLMLIDACHSGETDQTEIITAEVSRTTDGTVKSRGFQKFAGKKSTFGLPNSFELMQQLFADLSKGTGAVIISSAGGNEYAYESPLWNNGVFTYSYLEGIKSAKADLNKDGNIMASEIRDYVSKQVSTLTQGKQTPTSRKENLEFDFKVW